MDTTILQREAVKNAAWGNVLLGIWLVMSPFILKFSNLQTAMWNDIIVGLAIGLVVLLRRMGIYKQAALSWLNLLFGIWLIISPFAFGFSNALRPLWNNVIIALLVGLLALIN